MNIEKPVLTREQAEEKKEDMWYDNLVKRHAIEPWLTPANRCLNDLSIKDFATAVYYGYEVEQSPEEDISVRYEAFCREYDIIAREGKSLRSEYLDGWTVGTKETLDKLGIEIEGINKEDE